MSLNMDFSKTPNPGALWGEDNLLNPIYHQIIITLALLCDLPGINEKNFEEAMFRIRVVEKVVGDLFTDKEGKGVKVSRDMLKPLVGARWNVIEKTRTQFMKRMADQLSRDIAYDLKKELLK